MSFSLALYGDRGKKKGAGVGRGGIAIGDIGVTKFHQRVTKKQMTDVQIAVTNLEKELRSYQDITEATRFQWKDEMSGMEQVRYMNMKVLAAVLVLLHQLRGNLTPESFNDLVLAPYLARLLPTSLSAEDRAYRTLRFKETLLRYARAVLLYRADIQEQAQAIMPAAATEDDEEDDFPFNRNDVRIML